MIGKCHVQKVLISLEEVWKADHQTHFGMPLCCCSAAVRAHKHVQGCKEAEQVRLSILSSDHTQNFTYQVLSWCLPGGATRQAGAGMLPVSLLSAGLCRPCMCSCCAVICLPFPCCRSAMPGTCLGGGSSAWREAAAPRICEPQAPKAADEDGGRRNILFV